MLIMSTVMDLSLLGRKSRDPEIPGGSSKSGWDSAKWAPRYVWSTIEKLREVAPKEANIQVPTERYSNEPLYFDKLHGAHFLIEVGADGMNYTGPECKYEKSAELLDLNEYLEDDFLWHPQRLARIKQLDSDHYDSIGTRHRPPMFSDHIQKLIRRRSRGEAGLGEPSPSFSYPNIL